MKYLDEGIIFNFLASEINIQEDGLYQYRVTIDSELVFIGNCFCYKGKGRVLDVTEFVTPVNNYKYSNGSIPIYKVVQCSLNGKTQATEVLAVYRYPNYKSRMSLALNDVEPLIEKGLVPTYPKGYGWKQCFYYDAGADPGWKIMFENDSTVWDLPQDDITEVMSDHLPNTTGEMSLFSTADMRITTTPLTFRVLEKMGDEIDVEEGNRFVSSKSLNMSVIGFTYTKDLTISVKENVTELIRNEGIRIFKIFTNESNYVELLIDLPKSDFIAITYDYDGSVLQLKDLQILNADKIQLANLVEPCGYFLLWQDRLGGVQSQPFSAAETYSETFTRTEIRNFNSVRRLGSVDIQPKWTINSKFIPYELIPYYESIKLSPWLTLYDANEDKTYSVILTDTEFTEVTYKNNNRQLFYMTLELERTTTQKLIY